MGIRVGESLLRNDQVLRRVVDCVREAVVLGDTDRNIVFLNQAAGKIFGYAEDEVLGKPLSLLVATQYVSDYEKALSLPRPPEASRDSGEEVVTIGQKADGSEFPIGLAAASWITGDDRIHCLTIRDMSEQQAAERRAQLQDRLAAVGQLAAGIAHDFNNILVPITLYCEMMLEERGLKAKTQERLTIILSQARRAAELTQQFLDFSRMGVIDRRPLDLRELLVKHMKLLESTLTERISLELESTSDDFVVDADRGRLQQVFVNLAVNARDAMPDGGTLKFELSKLQVKPGEAPPFRDMSPGKWVRVQVVDQGGGIPPDILPHIFEPFFTTKPATEGSGLGLSQAYGLVKKHDGYIDAKSDPGGGATLTVYLPASASSAGDHDPEVGERTARGGGETILLVEDDPAVLESLGEVLTAMNYRVVTAADAEEALAQFEQFGDEIELVISDMVMPKMSGPELFQILRDKNWSVKMAMMTGYPLGGGTRELLDRRQVDWLLKPIEGKALVDMVARLLGTDHHHSKEG